jgi:hypothetical protein
LSKTLSMSSFFGIHGISLSQAEQSCGGCKGNVHIRELRDDTFTVTLFKRFRASIPPAGGSAEGMLSTVISDDFNAGYANDGVDCRVEMNERPGWFATSLDKRSISRAARVHQEYPRARVWSHFPPIWYRTDDESARTVLTRDCSPRMLLMNRCLGNAVDPRPSVVSISSVSQSPRGGP